jgi:hypothetical protein
LKRFSQYNLPSLQMKLQQFDYNDGGALMPMVAPKLNAFLAQVAAASPDAPVDVAKIQVPLTHHCRMYLLCVFCALPALYVSF